MSIPPIGAQHPSVSAASASMPTTMASPAPTPAMNGTLSGIAGQLGMGLQDVKSSLAQGSTITDLAAQQGVSRDSLVSSVQSQIQSNRAAAGQAPADQTTLDRMVNRAFDLPRNG